jgi:rhodanese-related sulfurtransferase
MITITILKKLFLVSLGIILIVSLGFWIWLPANGLNAAGKFIPWKFKDVDHTTSDDLSEWLQDSSRTAPLLWDIRRLDEFSVSHLPNARHVPPETSDIDLKKLLREIEQPIVVYCSVGYRSAKMAQRLQTLGYTNVMNLNGAIFTWATEGHSLQGSNKVHPYNIVGRRMLRNDLEAN